tara:strand:- start:334 stop:465 length:132 start_codon:yes stop_codon:yes gene_type:complete
MSSAPHPFSLSSIADPAAEHCEKVFDNGELECAYLSMKYSYYK